MVRFTDFNFPQGITIFRESIILINWGENPLAIHIQSKRMAEQYKKFFAGLWEKSNTFGI